MRPLAPALLLCLATSLHAQTFTTGPCKEDHDWGGSDVRLCELRSTTLPLSGGQLNVLGKNGGIEVLGEDRRDIALEAEVITQASTREQAESMAREISITTDGTIQAKGPHGFTVPHRNWQVNYRLHVPHQLTAQLHTENGGIDLSRLSGKIDAETTNGGLHLDQLAGDINATTTNGGLEISLSGDHWLGAGLTARTTNGSVNLRAPSAYSAHLTAETTNGAVSVNFPITVQGTIRNRIETNLGQGGTPLRLETTNGNVSITRN